MSADRLRWLYLHPVPLPGREANLVQAASTCRSLAALGDEVFLIVPRLKSDTPEEALLALGVEPLEGLHVVVEPAIRLKNAPGWRSIGVRAALLFYLASLARRRPCVLFFRTLRDSRMARFALLAGRLLRIPVIYEAHKIFTEKRLDQGFEEDSLRRIRRLEGKVLGGADAVVTIHPLLAERIRRDWRPEGTIVTLPNAVSLPHVEPEGQPIDVVYAGSLFPWKGVDVLVEAVARLPKVRLVVVGGHPPDRLEALRALAAERGAADRVEFRGRLERAGALAALAAARVVVVPGDPSFGEGDHATCPMKLLEAMALGRAVVAADTGAIRTLLRPGEEALLYRPGDPTDLGGKLAALLADPERAERLGRAALAASHRFSQETRAAGLRELARRLVGGAGA